MNVYEAQRCPAPTAIDRGVWRRCVLSSDRRVRLSSVSIFRSVCRAPARRENLGTVYPSLYRQTYYGLRDVIGPLACDRSACVLPLQPARSGVPHLIEICPASTLKRMKLYRPYKGKSIAQREARELIWRSLQQEELKLAGRLKPIVLADPEGDVLDSLIAAWATYQAQKLIARGIDRARPEYRFEGYVYA
jgi:hypothetical protein